MNRKFIWSFSLILLFWIVVLFFSASDRERDIQLTEVKELKEDRELFGEVSSQGESTPVVVKDLSSGISAARWRMDKWLESHHCGVVIEQSQEGKLHYPGSLAYQGVKLSLGETPPLIREQLKIADGVLLLGDLDSRHSFVRRVLSVETKSGKVNLKNQLSVTFPRFSQGGGFVFLRDEKEISRMGVIIPVINVPEGSEEDPRWQFEVRLGLRNSIVSEEEIRGRDFQRLDSKYFVLLQSQSDGGVNARILWLRLNDGWFEIDDV